MSRAPIVLTNTLIDGNRGADAGRPARQFDGASIIAGSPRAFIGGVKFKF